MKFSERPEYEPIPPSLFSKVLTILRRSEKERIIQTNREILSDEFDLFLERAEGLGLLVLDIINDKSSEGGVGVAQEISMNGRSDWIKRWKSMDGSRIEFSAGGIGVIKDRSDFEDMVKFLSSQKSSLSS